MASTFGLLLASCSAEDVTVEPAEEQVVPSVAATTPAVNVEPRPEVDLLDYPLATCVVSGAELGTMGPPFPATVDDTRVVLCCSGCEGELRADPATYLAKLEAAEGRDVDVDVDMDENEAVGVDGADDASAG